MDLGQILRRLIDESGLTQAAYAEKIGVSRSRLNNWLQGTAAPARGELAEFCARMELDANRSADFYAACGVPLPATLLPAEAAS